METELLSWLRSRSSVQLYAKQEGVDARCGQGCSRCAGIVSSAESTISSRIGVLLLQSRPNTSFNWFRVNSTRGQLDTCVELTACRADSCVELTLVKSKHGSRLMWKKSKMQRKNKRRKALHKISLTITLSN